MPKHYMYLGADADKEPYYFHIGGDVADQIVGKWLLRNIEYAKESLAKLIHAYDRLDAEEDIKAFRRIYLYLTGEHLED